MGRKYTINDQQGYYFVTFTVVNWIDLFIRNEYREILVDSLNYCQRHKGLMIHAWCIMTSHVHLMVSAAEGRERSSIIRDFKGFTSRQLRQCIETNPRESRRK
ncbi:transposase [Fulvivirga sp. M361]|uniref:transposase n=1 Tax=Fulvivirga sp. M361 TaxID=2594266 RepID=UPI0021036452|nr:transposase [Fulvivirga sp. M361]